MKKILYLLLVISTLGFIIKPDISNAAIQLVKSVDFNTVYYIDGNNIRHPFPNLKTYQSWYGDDFSKIISVSNEFLQGFDLGNNITMRPGSLVKVRTSPKVYAVEQGGVLREITDEAVANDIYGYDWAKRVVDVPDVFFANYTIGENIEYNYQIPNGILYQDANTKKYFYKNNEILQPFEFEQAVLENNFKLTDALSGTRNIYTRETPIFGLSENIFDPAAKPMISNLDCENKNLKAAIIFLVKETPTSRQAEKVETIRQGVSSHYSWATNEMSEINLDYPITKMQAGQYLIRERIDGSYDVNNEVLNKFYEQNPDEFDFVFIFTNFRVPGENTNEIAHFSPVTNQVRGTGKNILDRSEFFGSQGKLKGVILMGDIDKYKTATDGELVESLDIVNHEILHNWAAYAYFKTDQQERNTNLLRQPDEQHWSYYAGFISPLGGSGWIDNGDGTFTSGLSLMNSNSRPYSQLDLYLMGLIPKQLVDPVFYIEPENKNEVSNTLKAKAVWVDIDQIIGVHGDWSCNVK